MAGSSDEAEPIDSALPTAASSVSALRYTSGGFSVGRALGTGDAGAGQYDLERRVLLWVGEDRTEEAVKKFFTEEMGRRRCGTLQVVCMDMWSAYANLVREYAPQAHILFDRFHIVKHLQEAVDQVRRSEMQRLSGEEKSPSRAPAGFC